MGDSAISRLTSLASESYGARIDGYDVSLPSHISVAQWRTLEPLYNAKNGFFAFESALQVFPLNGRDEVYGLAEWNSLQLWRHEFEDMTDGCLFFGKDIFGVQFCVFEKGIYTFNPETGAKEHLADDIEGWAQRILAEYADLTGFPLAHAWQAANRPLEPRERLAANLPFFLGGEYALENLTAADAAKLMSFLGCVARQTRHLPEGTKIQIRFT